MQIRCKTCGQLLYVPDNSDGKTIRCPACLEEFIFNSADFTDETAKHPAFNAIPESKPSGESLESEISDAMENGQSEKTNPVADTEESFPEYAMANSFVQTRIMKLQPLNLIDVITTSVRLFRRYFNLVLGLGLLLIIVNLLSLGLTYQIAPEMMNIQFQQTDSLAEKINRMVEFQKKTPIQTQILVCCVQYLSSFIIFYLFLGGMRIFLGIGRSQKVRFSLIFSCWNAIGRIILAIFALIFLLTGIVLAALLAAGIILSIGIAPSIAMGLGFVGFGVLFYLLLQLIFLFIIIVDSNAPVLLSFRLSRQIARTGMNTIVGLVLMYLFALIMMSSLVSLLFAPGSTGFSIACCVLGGLVVNPMMIIAISCCYLKAIGHFRDMTT